MKYNNRLFPHPVLGIEDDITLGEFLVELSYKSDKEIISLSPVIKLTEEKLIELVSLNKATFLVQVYCRATMFREVFKSTNTIPAIITIPAFKLKGDVEVDFFICASNDLEKYYSSNFNADYNKTIFSIEQSDILAYGGKAKFVANKTNEELKSVSSLIRIKNSGKHSKAMYNEYNSEKIEINLCEEDYERYQSAIKGGHWINIIHSSIVLPALIDALYFIEKPESQDYAYRRWYKALSEFKSNSKKTADCFQIAQNILDLPNNRTFEAIMREME